MTVKQQLEYTTHLSLNANVKWPNRLWRSNKNDNINSAVLKLGVATLFRVAKYYLRVARVYQHCSNTTDSLLFGCGKLYIF